MHIYLQYKCRVNLKKDHLHAFLQMWAHIKGEMKDFLCIEKYYNFICVHISLLRVLFFIRSASSL